MRLAAPINVAAFACLCLAAEVGAAEEPPLPDFQTCMSAEVARFERVLTTEPLDQVDDGMVEIFGVSGVEFCGTIGIVLCDRSDNPLGCQRFLAVTQDILRARVLHQLPEPQPASDDEFPEQLYGITHALAHGTSAGQDCAGFQPVLEMWCRAREANGRLRAAILAWQVARFLGQTRPALEAGWVEARAPTRPQARPRGQE